LKELSFREQSIIKYGVPGIVRIAYEMHIYFIPFLSLALVLL